MHPCPFNPVLLKCLHDNLRARRMSCVLRLVLRPMAHEQRRQSLHSAGALLPRYPKSLRLRLLEVIRRPTSLTMVSLYPPFRHNRRAKTPSSELLLLSLLGEHDLAIFWRVFESSSSDEILNGKTLDKNSHYFAKYCFEHGIELYVYLRNLTIQGLPC